MTRSMERLPTTESKPEVTSSSLQNRLDDTEWGCAIERRPARDNESGGILSQSRPSLIDDASTTEQQLEIVDIAIVGGGLVGLAVAIGLHKRGISCKVYERAPQLRSQSQGILCLQPNGQEALERIDPAILGLVKQIGCERKKLVVTTIDSDGNVTKKEYETGQDIKDKYGRFKIGMTWHNMQQVLASLLPPGIVVTGRSLTAFREENESVLLEFEKTPRVRARVVLACDGLFSVARRQIKTNPTLADDDAPIFFGQLNWGTIFETAKLPPNLHPPNAVHFFQKQGEPRWMSMLNDGGSGYTFWQLRVADPAVALSLSGNKGRGGLGLPGSKDALLPIVEASSDVYSAVQAIPEDRIFERSIVGRRKLPTWISEGGLVALVGDSAHGMHPTIGQGANSAFESAAAVVSALEAARGAGDGTDHWKSALSVYEESRKPRADLVQAFANMAGTTQATGAEVVSKDSFAEMLHWILSGNNQIEEAPAEVVKTLETFEPCNYDGVSPLW